MKMILTTTLLTMIVIAAASITLCAQGNPDRLTVSFSDPARVGAVHIDLMQGTVNIKTHTGRDVIITSSTRVSTSSNSRRQSEAEAQGMRRLESSATGLTVEENGNVMSIGTYRMNRNVNLDIEVPARTNLKIQVLNGGGITVDDVDGELDIQNNNGQITLNNVSGSVLAHSLNQRVLVTMKRVTPDKPMSFTSLNGNIDVTLPANVKGNLKLKTDNGDIFVDNAFDVQVKASPAGNQAEDTRRTGGRYRLETDKGIFATLNGGGPEFELRTMNGSVYIRKAK